MSGTFRGEAEFREELDVSRETFDRIRVHAELLRRWNASAGLVAASTLPDAWTRHFLDSAQLMALAPKSPAKWIDLGSGGGFPGMVLAALCAERRPEDSFVLVESNSRKCEFLRTVARESGVRVTVLQDRAERLAPQAADVAAARALAPLAKLLGHAERHLAPGGTGLFPKGANRKSELEAAKRDWSFILEEFPSRTSAGGAVLQIRDLRRA